VIQQNSKQSARRAQLMADLEPRRAGERQKILGTPATKNTASPSFSESAGAGLVRRRPDCAPPVPHPRLARKYSPPGLALVLRQEFIRSQNRGCRRPMLDPRTRTFDRRRSSREDAEAGAAEVSVASWILTGLRRSGLSSHSAASRRNRRCGETRRAHRAARGEFLENTVQTGSIATKTSPGSRSSSRNRAGELAGGRSGGLPSCGAGAIWK